jgi:hypothetical protein
MMRQLADQDALDDRLLEAAHHGLALLCEQRAGSGEID